MKEKENDQEDFSLYTEKIVVKPSVKFRGMIRFFKLIASALVFGVVSCGVIALCYPWMNERLNTSAQQREPLTIEKDSYPEPVTTEPEDESESGTRPQTEKYASGRLKAVERAQQSIVTIDCYRSSVDEVLTEGKSATETVGIVIGEVGTEYIILTHYAAITDSTSIVVKFSDFTEVNADLLGYEEQAGLALLSVPQGEIPPAVRGDIVAAKLDNSYQVKQGDMVVAAGKLYGDMITMDYGMVTKITTMSGMDNNYDLLETGFAFHEGDYGYLFNMSGNVIGISVPASVGETQYSTDSGMYDTRDSIMMLQAAGVSDLKFMIERLSSGSLLPYLGVRGQNVTNSIALAYGLPMGIYVTEVVMDSPAFSAGLQQGDVIVGFDGNMVLTFQAFNEKLYQCSLGQRITLTVKRPGKDNYREITFSLTVSAR